MCIRDRDSDNGQEESRPVERLVLLEDGRLVSEEEAAKLEAEKSKAASQESPAAEPEEERGPVTLLFGGDVLLSNHVLNLSLIHI